MFTRGTWAERRTSFYSRITAFMTRPYICSSSPDLFPVALTWTSVRAALRNFGSPCALLKRRRGQVPCFPPLRSAMINVSRFGIEDSILGYDFPLRTPHDLASCWYLLGTSLFFLNSFLYLDQSFMLVYETNVICCSCGTAAHGMFAQYNQVAARSPWILPERDVTCEKCW